jgi:IS605 OrfB family transposase
MTTLKILFETVSDFTPFLKECNKVKRIAFNLFREIENVNKVTRKIKGEYTINYDLLDASILEFQVLEAHSIYKSCLERKQEKLIFGSLREWKRFNKGIISKDEFNNIKNTQPVLFTGRSNESFGNRKIKLDIDHKQIIFKRARNEHHYLKLKTSNSRWKILEKLQTFFEYDSTPITYKLTDKYVYITFDESILKEKEHEFIENRVGSLDLNPNYIAFTIQDFPSKEQVYKSVFDLTKLNQTHNKDKKDYEVVQIAKTISELALHYKVEIVGSEQLTMTSKNHKKGKRLNRLINNTWNRNCFSNNLKKRLNILGIKNQEIAPQYSSTIGCLMNPDETDSIGAALEIGRRTYMFSQKYLKKNKEFLDKDIIYPTLDYKAIRERWNSILGDYSPKRVGWVGIHNYLKEQKKLTELRFLFKDYDFSRWSCYRHKSDKSLVLSCCC